MSSPQTGIPNLILLASVHKSFNHPMTLAHLINQLYDPKGISLAYNDHQNRKQRSEIYETFNLKKILNTFALIKLSVQQI
jgi:hypothetical protein